MSNGGRRIGIVGAGWIGTTVCADLVLHGFRVVVVDIDQTQLDRASQDLAEAVRFAPMLRPSLAKMTSADATAAVSFGTELAALRSCEFVIENVSERWETKLDVYRQLDAGLPAGVGIGVNTSSIEISRIAAQTARPQWIVGIHFMNPAYLSDAVEVIPGAQTSDACLAYVESLAGALGKEAIVVGDFPGFVSNRVSHVFFNEAARLVQEHRATPPEVDKVFRKCFGHRMGPLETADLIGIDTVVLTLDNLAESYADARFSCCELLREMVAAGQLGRKSGVGFYSYPPA